MIGVARPEARALTAPDEALDLVALTSCLQLPLLLRVGLGLARLRAKQPQGLGAPQLGLFSNSAPALPPGPPPGPKAGKDLEAHARLCRAISRRPLGPLDPLPEPTGQPVSHLHLGLPRVGAVAIVVVARGLGRSPQQKIDQPRGHGTRVLEAD